MVVLATLCYIQNNGKTLMLHRNKRPKDIHLGKYNGLGGKFEQNESPEECVKREIFEESGLTIKNLKLRGILTFPNFFGDDWMVFVYTTDTFTGELKENHEGTLEWIDDDKILNLPLWESDSYFIKWMCEGKFFSAKFNYDGKKMKDFDVVFY